MERSAKMGQRFEDAENRLLGKPAVLRPSGNRTGNRKAAVVIEAVTRIKTAEFFNNILTDEIEARLWMTFMTGKAPKMERVRDEHGDLVETTILVDVEPNPTSLKAFLRAVEYKRGAPVVLRGEGDTKDDGKVIQINVIGATPQYFEQAAKAKGFLTKGV